jgi:hypothetical protein
MLIEFRVKNFKSFRDEQVFSMVASTDKSLPTNTISTSLLGGRKLVRSAVLYGANASGKSNLIQALGFVQDFVETSAERKRGSEILVQPFRLDSDNGKLPSEFEINFIHLGVRFQYSFSVDYRQVYEERLIAYPKGLPQIWFERTPITDLEKSEWYFGPQLKGEKNRLISITRPDVLFLSVAATFNHRQLTNVYEWFSDHLRVVDANDAMSSFTYYTAKQALNSELAYRVIKGLLDLADLGIKDFSVEEKSEVEDELPNAMPDELRSALLAVKRLEIQMHHYSKENKIGVSFSFEDESLGTRRFFGLIGPLLDTLIEGYTLVVDELDASMHPILVKSLVDLFQHPTLNDENAQLIFNTHDTTLLNADLFRRDQIWFVEKDKTGASHLYPLLDFSPRKDEALEKGYLQGRYGAIPFLGDIPAELTANVKR